MGFYLWIRADQSDVRSAALYEIKRSDWIARERLLVRFWNRTCSCFTPPNLVLKSVDS